MNIIDKLVNNDKLISIVIMCGAIFVSAGMIAMMILMIILAYKII